MSKPINPKYLGENGIHRVPLWRIGGFALNNTATNFYLFMMSYVSYYLIGFVGVATVLASSFSTIMRLWDGVTDPFVGMLVDKTDGRFGKNRPFMVFGNIILAITSWVLFHVTHLLPDNWVLRFAFFTVVSAVYYLGYTAQCVVTKSAQAALTNDPKQRPLFAIFDSIYNSLLWTILAIVTAQITAKYDNTFYRTEVFHELWVITAVISGLFTAIAVFSLAPKDRTEFFGTGVKGPKVGIKDYIDCICHNRAIQMLVISASSDKLAAQSKTTAVTAVLFGVVAGNYALNGTVSGLLMIPNILIVMLMIGGLATRLGQRKAMLIGSWGNIVVSALLAALWIFGDATSLGNSDASLNWGFFTIAYVVLTVIWSGFQALSGSLVIPMTADCADYEVYRTGRYVPGMMGTLFSFVDKLISSAAPMVAGLIFAAIGFTEKLPDQSTPYSDSLKYAAVFLAYGMIILGLICNVVALKFYPLTKEKMAEIQVEIAAIKAKATAEQN